MAPANDSVEGPAHERDERPARDWLFGTGSFMLWVAVGVFLVAFFIAATTYYRAYGKIEPTFLEVLVWQLVTWAPWLLGAPAVARLSERFPLARPRSSLPIHVLGSILFAVVHAWWFFLISTNMSPYLESPKTGYGVFRFFFIFWFQLDLLIYWILAGFVYSRQSLLRLRERERRAAALELQLVESQLEALKLQIRPHFLFNTLNTIVVMQRGGEHEKALRMTLALSELLRLLLSADEEGHEVPLARDLELLERYLEIEQYRFEGRLTVARDIDPATLAARVPPVLLQPIVENAIRHGVARKTGSGDVRIAVHRDGAELAIEVSNGAADRPAIADSGFGIGLTNIRRRLEELYGDAHELTIAHTDAGRTVVNLRLPWHEEALNLAPEAPSS